MRHYLSQLHFVLHENIMILFMPPYHKLTKTTMKTTIITTHYTSSIRSGIMNKISYN